MLTAGCGTSSGALQGSPLYPVSGQRLPPDKIAQLTVKLPYGGGPGNGATSFIRAVDGRDVSAMDPVFDLLPGCHVVETESNFLMTNGNITWTGVLGSRGFVFPMKAGFQYVIVVDLRDNMGDSGRISVIGVEQDASGKQTRTFGAFPPALAAKMCGQALSQYPFKAVTPPPQ
jgi:hypothetical protein